MTLTEFIQKWDGKTLDYDGAYGGQCVDVTKAWAKENGKPVLRGNGINWARGAGYEWVDYQPGRIPNPGDIVVWGKALGQFGHVAIFIEGGKDRFTSFDQNYPLRTRCHRQGHDYKGVLGWLRVLPTAVPPQPNQGGETVTQRQKDFEKMYVIFQILNLSAPPHENVEKDLNHIEGIRLALIKEGKTEHQADTLKWDQFFRERVKDYQERYREIGRSVGAI